MEANSRVSLFNPATKAANNCICCFGTGCESPKYPELPKHRAQVKKKQKKIQCKHQQAQSAENDCILHDGGPALVSFHPGSHQISVQRAACVQGELHVVPLVGSSRVFFFSGVTGLFPAEWGGIVSVCYTWAEPTLCAQESEDWYNSQIPISLMVSSLINSIIAQLCLIFIHFCTSRPLKHIKDFF